MDFIVVFLVILYCSICLNEREHHFRSENSRNFIIYRDNKDFNKNLNGIKTYWIDVTKTRIYNFKLKEFQNCKLLQRTSLNWIQHDENKNNFRIYPELFPCCQQKFTSEIQTIDLPFECLNQNISTMKIIQLKVKTNEVATKTYIRLYFKETLPDKNKLQTVLRLVNELSASTPYILDNKCETSKYTLLETYGKEKTTHTTIKVGFDNYLNIKNTRMIANSLLTQIIIPLDKIEIFSKPFMDLYGENNETKIETSIVRKRRQLDPFSFFNIPGLFNTNRNQNQDDCSTNNRPVAKQQETTIAVDFNQYSHIKLPNEYFTDPEDGSSINLKVSLTWFNDTILKETDWLQFSPTLQFISTWMTYEVFKNQPAKGYKFKVTAEDKCNAKTSMTFYLKTMTDNAGEPCYYTIVFVESKMNLMTHYVHMLVSLANIIGSYFNDSQLKHIIVNNFQYLSRKEKLLKIEFFDQNIKCKPCDVKTINQISKDMDDARFQQRFKPNFLFRNYTTNFKICDKESIPVRLYNIPILNITEYYSTKLTIPEALFYDPINGILNALNLKPERVSSVILLNINNTIFGYQITSKIYQGIFRNNIETYKLASVNSRNFEISTEINIKTNINTIKYEQNYYSLTFASFFKDTPSKEMILSKFLTILNLYLTMPYDEFILINYEVTNVYPQNTSIVFTTKNVIDSKNAFDYVKNLIFDGSKLSDSFIQVMSPPFYNIRPMTYDIDDKQIIGDKLTSLVSSFNEFVDNTKINSEDVLEPIFGSTPHLTMLPISIAINPFPVQNINVNKRNTIGSRILIQRDSIEGVLVTNNAPVITQSIGPFNTSFCDFFVFPIPEGLFVDTIDGNTRNLRLKLKSSSGQFVSKHSWIQIDTDIQVIYGFLKVSDYIRFPSKQLIYYIEASNSRNLSTSLPILINLPDKLPTIFYEVEMTLSTFYDSTVPDINEQLLLLLKVASYFGEPKFSWVNILSFSRNNTANIVTFGWTNCTIKETNECSTTSNTIQYLSSKVILTNGNPSSQFASFLAPQYIIRNIKVSTNIKCPEGNSKIPTTVEPVLTTPGTIIKPKVLNEIPILNIYTTEYFTYKIPFDTFFDERDGYTPYLTLEMTSKNGNPISKGSWIQFNMAAQEIYAYIYVSLLQGREKTTYQYTLKAINSKQVSTALTITFNCIREQIPLGGLQVAISGSEYYSSSMNHLQVLLMFLQKYYQYLSKTSDIEVTWFDRISGPPGRFSLTFIHNQYVTELQKCNITDINLMKSKLNYWDREVNPFLILNFLPEVVIQYISINAYGECTDTGPTPNIPRPPFITQNIPMLSLNNYEIFTYQIPETTFKDSIDGGTRNLTLYLLSNNGMKLEGNTWIYMENDQTIIATFYSNLLQYNPNGEFKFVLRAMNSKGLYTDMTITLKSTVYLNDVNFQVVYNGYYYFRSNIRNVEIIKYILEKFYTHLHQSINQKMTALVNFERISTRSSQFAITFTDKRFGNGCNRNELTNNNLLNFMSPSGEINPLMTMMLSPQILLTNVKLITNNVCSQTIMPSSSSKMTSVVLKPTPTPTTSTTTTIFSNTAPRVNILIPPIEINFCETIYFTLDPETFTDKEEGSSKNLRIEIHFFNNTKVPTHFWLQMDTPGLAIYGHLDLKSFKNYKSIGRLLLKAFDNEGLYATTDIPLRYPRNMFTFNHQITMVVSKSNQQEENLLKEELFLIRKIKKFFNDERRIQVISTEIIEGNRRFKIDWTVCSLRYNPCPTDDLLLISNEIISKGNVPSIKLQSLMLPETQVFEIKMTYKGPCQGFTIAQSTLAVSPGDLNPTQVIVPSKSTPYTMSTINIKAPILVNPIPIIKAIQCQEFRYTIPANTFYDTIDGNTNNLKLQFVQKNNQPIPSHSWIQFDAQNQYLYGFVTDYELQQKKLQKFKIIATNTFGLSTENDITVELPYLNMRQYSFILMFSLKDTDLTPNQIIRLVTQKINSFVSMIHSIRIILLKKFTSDIYTLQWSDCDLITSACMRNKIETIKDFFYIQDSILRSKFLNYMQPEVNIFQMTFQYEGLCSIQSSKMSTSVKHMTSTSILLPSPTTPTPQNIPPSVLKSIPMLFTTPCQKFIYQLPEDTFFDVEDGLARNLKIEIYDNNMVPLNENSWLIFYSSNQTFIGVLTMLQITTKTEFIYNVIATDSGALKISQKMTIKVEDKGDDTYTRVIETTGSIYKNMRLNDLNIYIHDNLYKFLITESTTWKGIRIHSIDIDPTYGGINIRWSVCGLPCEQNNVLLLRSKLFSTNDAIKVSFAVLMNPNVIITGATITDNDYCSVTIMPSSSILMASTRTVTPTPNFNSPPIIFMTIPILTISMCQRLRYKLPENTCYDSQDGFTPKLKLRLVYPNSSNVGFNSWIQLNEETQELYGNLKTSDLKSTVNKMFTYVLLCIDSQGATASQNVYVLYNEVRKSPNYEIQMQSYVYFQNATSYTDIQITWISKLKKFLNDYTNSNIHVNDFRMSTVLYPQIIISWYNCSIVDPCGFESRRIYNQLFNRYGSFNSEFTQSMVPEFVVISGKFSTKENCFSTTPAPVMSSSVMQPVNKPPMTLRSILSISLQSCKPIKYRVPPTTFYDYEDGYTPNLSLTLVGIDYKQLDKSSYIQFNQTTQTINGVVVYSDYLNRRKFILIAYDSKGLKTETIAELNIDITLDYSSHVIYASGALYFNQNIHNKVTLLNLLSEKISRFYGDKDNYIMYKNVYITQKTIELEWMNCTLIKHCNLIQLEKVKQKVSLPNNLINTNFINSLAPMFVITYTKFQYSGPCNNIISIVTPTQSVKPTISSYVIITPTPIINTPPVSLKPMIFVNVDICSSFSYRIPADTFKDIEDGDTTNLKLSLLTSDMKALGISSWVQFVDSTQVIYGHIRISSLKQKQSYTNYVLKAEDTGGLSVTTSLTFILPPKPDVSYRVNITVTKFFDLSTPDLTVQLFLVSKICSYINDVDLTNVLVLSFERTLKQTFLSWTNCSFVKAPCNRKQIQIMERDFNLNSISRFRFQSELLPQYELIRATTEILPLCRFPSTTSIAPSYRMSTSFITSLLSVSPSSTIVVGNRPPRINMLISSVKIQFCESFAYHIPKDIFLDEDGDTHALKLELRNINGSVLSRHSWIQFNDNLQVAFGVIKIKDIEQQPISGYKYILKAIDSRGLSTITMLPIGSISTDINVGFYYKMKIKCSNINSYPIVNDLFQLINKLILFFGDTSSNTVKTVDLTEDPGDKNILIFSWTNCTAAFDTCPYDLINYMNNKLIDINEQPNKKLQELFSPQYILQKIELIQQFTCEPSTTPSVTTPVPYKPVLNKYIDSIFVKQCQYLSYKIPNDIFYDPQDGYTRNLYLTMTFNNGSQIPTSYWLKFHTTEQRIIGYPVQALQYGGAPFGYYLFKITASDREGNTASTNVQLSIIYSNQISLQNITLELALNFDLQLPNNMLLNMIENRIYKYYGDNDRRYLQILKFKKEKNIVEIKWSNCSLNILPCDKLLANQIQDRIMNDKGLCKSQFSYVFLPEFTVQKLGVVNDKYCQDKVTPTPTKSIVTPTTSSVSQINTIYVFKNITIPFSFCGGIMFNITGGIFYDLRDGNTNYFQYSLHYTDKLPVTCNSWIQYDILTNSIYGTAIHTDKNTPTHYLLQARNMIGQTAYTNIFINSNIATPNVTYKFSVSFYTTLNDICDVELLRMIKQKIEKYFNRVGKNELSVIYFSRGNRLTRNYVMFSNCSLATSKCNYRAINQISEMLLQEGTLNVREELKLALQPEFYSLSVLDEKMGTCSKVTVLAVGKVPKDICARFCEEFFYDLNSVFVDADGNQASNLIIEISEIDGTRLSESSWIGYNGNGSLIGLLSEEVYTAQPKIGYQYLITAYDLSGAQTQTVIEIKICGDMPTYESSVTLQFTCKDNIEDGLNELLNILKKYSNKYSDGTLNSIHLINYKIQNETLIFTVTNCTTGTVKLSSEQLENLNSFSKCELINSTDNDHKQYPPEKKYNYLRYKYEFCKENKFIIPEDTFYDREDGGIANLSLTLLETNESRISNNSWIALHARNLKLYILPNKNTNLNFVYEFTLLATDSSYKSTNLTIYVELFTSFPPRNILLMSTFIAYSSFPLVIKVQTFFEKLNLFMGSYTKFALISSSMLSNHSITMQFSNCSLNYSPCPYKEIKTIESSILTNSKAINAELVLRMFPECLVERFTITKEGPCLLLPDSPPQLRKVIPVIHVTDCGYVKYKIPNETFYDEQDGWTGNLTLKMFTQNTCWFEFDSTTQIIHAIVTKDALSKQPQNGYVMFLQAIDSRQTSVNTTITLRLHEFKKASYEVAILFEINKNPFTTCLSQKIYLVTRLTKFYDESATFSLKSTSESADNRLIELTITNCTMRYKPCDYVSIDNMINKIQNNDGKLNSRFIQQMRPFYIPRFIAQRKDTICIDSNNKPPVITGQIELPIIYSNSCIVYQLKEYLITDFEDGGLNNLDINLLNKTTGKAIGNSSWIYLDIVTKQLFITSNEFVVRSKNSSQFLLSFTDSRDAITEISFNVNFAEDMVNKNISYIINEEFQIENETSVFTKFICKWKSERQLELNESIRILDFFAIEDDVINITWTGKKQPKSCDEAEIVMERVEKYLITKTRSKYSIIKLDHCFTELPPNATKNNTIFTNPCQHFEYHLPESMFTDKKYGNTSSLDVKVHQIYPNNVIRGIVFNEASQTFTGILLVDIFLENNFIEYNVTAANPAKLSASTSIKFYLNETFAKYYEFKVQATYYGSKGTMVEILKSSFNLLSSYLNINGGVLYYNLTLLSTIEFIFTFSPCVLSKKKCAVSKFEETVNLLKDSSGRPTFNFISAMENIVARDVIIYEYTKCNDSPVQVGFNITLIEISLCGSNRYKIPNNAFLDIEDGNVDNGNLTLVLRNSDKFPWIRFSSRDKTLLFQVTAKEVINQPETGYVIIIEAKDSAENQAFQNITLLIKDDLTSFNYLIQLKSQVIFYDIKTRELLLAILYNRLERLFETEEQFKRVIIYDLNIYGNNKNFNFSIYNCKLNQDFCQAPINTELLTLFRTIESIRDKVKQLFLPEFFITDVDEVNINKCENVSNDLPYQTSEIPVFNLSLFDKITFKLPIGFFSDKTDGYLTEGSIKLVHDNDMPISKSNYLQYYEKSNEIRAFITQDQNKKLNKKYDQFIIQGTDSNNNKVRTRIKVILPKEITNNVVITTQSRIVADLKTLPLTIICDFVERINSYIKNNVTIIESKQSLINPDTLTILWTIDELTNIECNKSIVEYLSIMILQSKNLYNPYYIQALGINAGFIHVNTTIEQQNYCLDKNTPPVTQQNITLNVSLCGFINFELPINIFIDFEDGNISNLNLQLYKENKRVENNFWLQLNNKTKQIFGVIAENIKIQEATLFILATDSGNLTARAYVNISLETFDHEYVNRNLTVVTTVQCIPHSKLKTSILLDILNYQFTLTGITNQSVRLKEVTNEKTVSYITWTTCDNYTGVENISRSINKTIDDCKITDVEISYIYNTTIIPSTTINPSKSTSTIITTSSYSANQNPFIVNNLPNVIFDCGKPYKISISANTFYDYQDGSSYNLKLQLINSSTFVSGYKYLNFDDVLHEIIFFISTKNCQVIPIDPFVFLQATDKNGNSVIDSFTVTKNEQRVSCCIAVTITLNTTLNIINNNMIYKYFTTLAKVVYNQNTGNEIFIVNVVQNNLNFLEITHTNKTIANDTCTKEDLKTLTEPLLNNDLTPSQSFSTIMKDFNIITVKTIYNPECNITRIAEPTEAPFNAPEIGDPPTATDWFLYLLPLFILAFILLAACACFYICRYCYGSVVSKDKEPLIFDVDIDERDNDVNLNSTLDDGDIGASTKARVYSKPFETIPKINEEKVPLPVNMPLKQSWDIEDNMQVNQKDILSPLRMHTVQVERYNDQRRRTVSFDRETNPDDLYAKPFRKKIYQRSSKQLTDEADVLQRASTTSFIENRRPKQSTLKLPTIPNGPPPPYSPPRRSRIFKQNILPHYYERYSQPRTVTPVILPVKQTIIKNPRKTTILTKRRRLPSLRRSRRYKLKKLEEPIDISETSSITDTSEISVVTTTDSRSESPIEIRALLKGKEHTLRKILRKPRTVSLDRDTSIKIQSDNQYGIDRAGSHSRSTTKSRLKNRTSKLIKRRGTPSIEKSSTKFPSYKKVEHKFTKPYLYDYVPVRRKSQLKNMSKRIGSSRRKLVDSPSEKSNDGFRYSFLRRSKKKKKTRPTLDELLDAIPEEVLEDSFSPQGKKNYRRRKSKTATNLNGTLEEIEDAFSDDSL